MSIRNIARSTGALLKDLWSDSRLWWGGLVTSWFWLVGAVVLSLMPPLVKSVLGATEEVVTAFLAVFSISIAIGSGLAAWLAHGRIVLLPTRARRGTARAFLARSRLERLRGAAAMTGRRRARCSPRGRACTSRSISRASRSRAACSSCPRSRPCSPGPAPTSAPAWSPPVNVLNAAFIVGGTLVVAALASLRCDARAALPADRRRQCRCHCLDLEDPCHERHCATSSSFLLRAVYRMEVKGAENLDPAKAGPNPIIALNHVELPRRRGRAVADGQGAGVRDRLQHRAALVGEAVPQAHARDAARSARSRWRRAR